MTDYFHDKDGEPIPSYPPMAATAPTKTIPLPSAPEVFNFRGARTASIEANSVTLIPQSDIDSEFIRIFVLAREKFFRKNADYGNSWREHGLKGVFIRWADKYKRLNQLLWHGNEAHVKDESIADTIDDAFVYNLMMIFLMKRKEITGSNA